MSSDKWLVAEERPATPADLDQTAREAESMFSDIETRGAALPRLSVLLRDVICRDVHKWFGGAQIRLDALVVHGNVAMDDAPSSAYAPGTFRFPDIHDNQPFPLDPNGLLIFDGKPAFFMDVFLMASRDRGDSDDLASLLRERLGKEEFQVAASTILTLAMAVPTAAAIAGAIGAAAVLGDAAYQVVKAVSPKTIGMYRGSFLQFRDGFGLGRHPLGEGDKFLHGDFQFWYETVLNEDQTENA